ncbi:Non-reducing end beta-L-arabinofuranosidase [subsurface metagenome]
MGLNSPPPNLIYWEVRWLFASIVVKGGELTKMIKKELTPAQLGSVTIDDSFWAPRMKINRERTIPYEYKMFKATGRMGSLKLGWEPGKEPVPHFFWDSDIYKWIEAASYSLTTHPDSQLDSLIDGLVGLITKAQQPDGYLNTYYTVVEPGKRWTNLRDRHELYCAGHLLEAAVAHFQATGKRTLLDVACCYADYIDTLFGSKPGKKPGYPGHEEIELALIKLYQVTGERRYATLSKFFVDERGQQPHYYDREATERGEDPAKFWAGTYEYNQSHKPVREQNEAVGHAVRAMYLYSGMADVAAEFGDEQLRTACDRLWNNLTSKRMYITGGIGPSRYNEGFTEDYDLPNETAYAETCAAVGLVFWAHRMLQFECDGHYADVMERALYNGALSGVSLDGEKFFYGNPLTSLGNHHRQEWFECACCPPNIARLIASLGKYVYSQSETDAIVHLYVGGSASLHVAGQTVGLRMDTRYPWDGKVIITVEPETPASFGLKLRIPAWCRQFHLKVNGRETKSIKPQRGYLRIERKWKAGDCIELSLSMPIELVRAHPEVREDIGCVAIQRGPLVYCLEQVDNKVPLHRVVLPEDAKLEVRFEQDLLDGVVVIHGDAVVDDSDWDAPQLYHLAKEQRKCSKIRAIPYYAWDNREPGEMRVWIRTDT